MNLPVLAAEVLESVSVTSRFGSSSCYPFLCVLDSAVFNVFEEIQNKDDCLRKGLCSLLPGIS